MPVRRWVSCSLPSRSNGDSAWRRGQLTYARDQAIDGFIRCCPGTDQTDDIPRVVEAADQVEIVFATQRLDQGAIHDREDLIAHRYLLHLDPSSLLQALSQSKRASRCPRSQLEP